jgi:hypothetical protein
LRLTAGQCLTGGLATEAYVIDTADVARVSDCQ